MKVVPLNTIFTVSYGNKFDLNKMKITSLSDPERINFVSRTEQNNGVSEVVVPLLGVKPYDDGCITVALGGAILASFVQVRRFYTAQNVAVLKPKVKLTIPELLYYCRAIEHNKFRYSAFGREANRTLKTLLVPGIDCIPAWVKSTKQSDISAMKKAILSSKPTPFNTMEWKEFKLGGDDGLFKIEKGKRLTKEKMKPGKTLFIGSTDSRNGVTASVSVEPIHEANTLSVCYNGSVAEAFYQPNAYWATDDVNVLYPNFKMNVFTGLFLTTLIRREKYRYNYGRKWHLGRMKESIIKLPITKDGHPDWQYMESYMKSLPYSSAIQSRKK